MKSLKSSNTQIVCAMLGVGILFSTIFIGILRSSIYLSFADGASVFFKDFLSLIKEIAFGAAMIVPAFVGGLISKKKPTLGAILLIVAAIVTFVLGGVKLFPDLKWILDGVSVQKVRDFTFSTISSFISFGLPALLFLIGSIAIFSQNKKK